MTGRERPRGNWPDLAPGEYERLVRLARRRLVGYDHHAEDVVSRALIKWANLPAPQLAVGRIEQVIKSEASSLLRSESRRRQREMRVANDPSQRIDRSGDSLENSELNDLRQAIAQTCEREKIRLNTQEVEFIELLFSGLNLAETSRSLAASRYEVRKIRDKWRRILKQLAANDKVG